MKEKLQEQVTTIPKVGDKCTMYLYSDCHACQVVRVSASGKTMWVRRNVVIADESAELGIGHQNWIIYGNRFSGNEMKCTKRKDGRWRESRSNNLITIGLWHEYYDWEF